MCKVYVYKADLLCYECGVDTYNDLRSHNIRDTEDSDTFPQGPESNGGGEADSPQHCGKCERFLENPLTSHGVEYVKEAVQRYNSLRTGNPRILQEWLDYYEIDYEIQERMAA